jgi:DNA invertase Pin-like site-specific DNA recombinase
VLERALDYIREGDVFIVTKLDRVARSIAHLVEIVVVLERKEVSFRILDVGIDTGCPTGRLYINLLGSIAQFEREIMLERQRDGIAKAKGEGKYKGRKPTARAKAAETLAELGIKRDDIARQLKVGVASVYRILAAGRAVSFAKETER